MSAALSSYTPARQPVGMAVVITAHVALGWALLNALGTRLVDLEFNPLEVDIVEPPPTTPPPPPPPLEVQPPPMPPPPSFVPLPEVKLRPPPVPPPPAITVQRTPPPPAPVAIAPPPRPAPPAPAPVAPPTPPAPPAPPVRVAPPPAPPVDLSRPPRMDAAACTRPDYPRAARRAEATGTTRLRLQIDASGRVVSTQVLQSAGRSREHRLLDRAAATALSQCRFEGGRDAQGRPTGGHTTVEYVWTLE
jgi:protein TonB